MGVKIPNILFCRCGYMKYYRGIANDDVQCIGGGKYNKKNVGLESYNFYNYETGQCYGYVYSSNGKLDIDKIASDTSKYKKTNKDDIDNVLVIFVAMGMVVGFYKHAKVYRDLQKNKNPVSLALLIIFLSVK